MIRYVNAEGTTLKEMRAAASKTDLYQLGDMKLVWVNEGDLYASQISPVQSGCPYCDGKYVSISPNVNATGEHIDGKGNGYQCLSIK